MGVPPKGDSYIDMTWLDAWPAEVETEYLRLIEIADPAILKIDGKISQGVILQGKERA